MIDYSRLGRAVDYYQRQGYKYIEVPWIVSDVADNITKPGDKNSYYVDAGKGFTGKYVGNLVASGEQSFIQLMINLKLEPGKYVCVTPCFREEVRDKTHQDRFMKVELINTLPEAGYAGLMDMVLDASKFFWNEGLRTCLENSGEKQLDIVQRGTKIELGSYGFREYKNHKWVFGTGAAEPRMTIAKNEVKEKQLTDAIR